MSIRNVITENIILQISDFLLGYSISKHLKFLLESQWWSESQLIEYQNIKLRALVKHAYKNVPYYSALFKKLHLTPEDIETTDDLIKLPILTKEEIKKNFKNRSIIAKNIPSNKIILSSTSGSTGEPLHYYSTKESESFKKACAIRGWYWMGYRLGDKYVKISQYERPFHKRIQDFINNSKYISSQQLTDDNFRKMIKEINDFSPKIIRSYPDQLKSLSSYCRKNNVNVRSPISITTTGSKLHNIDRSNIEHIFKTRIFDSYSCEGGANISECETHRNYHSSMEYAITEIINTYKLEDNCEKGRLITTDLHNYAVPFIRYDSQDFVTKSLRKCSCGRNLLTIKEIDGRDSDILVTPSGKKIIAIEFGDYFQFSDSIDQFQVKQQKVDEIDILLKVNDKYTFLEEKRIYNYWSNYIGESVKIIIKVTDEIPLTSSGKRRYLIRNKNIKLNM